MELEMSTEAKLCKFLTGSANRSSASNTNRNQGYNQKLSELRIGAKVSAEAQQT
jgi:hypothetical protein